MNRRELMKLAGAALVSPVLVKPHHKLDQDVVEAVSVQVAVYHTELRDGTFVSRTDMLRMVAGEWLVAGDFVRKVEGFAYQCRVDHPEMIGICGTCTRAGLLGIDYDVIDCIPLPNGITWKI